MCVPNFFPKEVPLWRPEFRGYVGSFPLLRGRGGGKRGGEVSCGDCCFEGYYYLH